MLAFGCYGQLKTVSFIQKGESNWTTRANARTAYKKKKNWFRMRKHDSHWTLLWAFWSFDMFTCALYWSCEAHEWESSWRSSCGWRCSTRCRHGRRWSGRNHRPERQSRLPVDHPQEEGCLWCCMAWAHRGLFLSPHKAVCTRQTPDCRQCPGSSRIIRMIMISD